VGRYGLGGVLAENRNPRARAVFGTTAQGSFGRNVSFFRVFFQAWPGGGDLELHVDDGPPLRVSTQSAVVQDRHWDITLSEGAHRLTVTVAEGDLRLYGVALETDGPGVVVDALMYLGVSVGMLRHWNVNHLEEQIRQRQPDLLVFWIGANDVRAAEFAHDEFVEQYGNFIAHARAGRPEASCLVMSEPDQAIDRDGRLRSRRRVPRIVAAQEATAVEQGCGFLNLYAAFGGRGAARRWYRGSPRLIVGDYLHLTAAGAQVVGERFELALLRGYDGYLEELAEVRGDS
jgi:lysophospholipase L1-like esterase